MNKKKPARPIKEAKRRKDKELDKRLEDTFPASDATAKYMWGVVIAPQG